MNNKGMNVFASLCAAAVAGVLAAPASAQTIEVKEKPPMYSYEAFWTIPRAQWGEMEKAGASNQKLLEKAVARGTLVGFGDDTAVIHNVDGSTHGDWWSSMSMAGVLNTLDEIGKGSGPAPTVLTTATKHHDGLYVSRYYNWKAGTWKGAYTRWAGYTLKPDAPDDAIDVLAKNVTVPLMEKLLADGTIVEYEIDVEAVHTESPDSFGIVFITPTAEGLDKVGAALREASKKAPMNGIAMDAFTDYKNHRDALVRSNVTFK